MAFFIESVIRSAYMMTLPRTLRAARPKVWISERSVRRKPSLSASRIATSDTSGQIETLAQEVDADQHVELAAAQIAEDLDALQRVDVRVQVAHPHAELGVVLGQILGHALGQRRDQHALVRLDPLADLAEQIVDLMARPGGPRSRDRAAPWDG